MEFLSELLVDIKKSEVLRYLGYKAKTAPQGEAKEILEDAVRRGYQLVQPRAIYTWAKVKEMNRRKLLLEQGLRLSVGSAIKLWKGAEYLAIVLCTIGPALENQVSELFTQGELALALMLDSVGSVAVDSVADHVNYVICREANQSGLSTGPRLSPGYGKWALEDQRVVFSILPGEKVGIQLNEHFVMTPRKSISFGVGIGRSLESRRKINPCQYCDMESCQYRVAYPAREGEQGC